METQSTKQERVQYGSYISLRLIGEEITTERSKRELVGLKEGRKSAWRDYAINRLEEAGFAGAFGAYSTFVNEYTFVVVASAIVGIKAVMDTIWGIGKEIRQYSRDIKFLKEEVNSLEAKV